MQSLYHHDRIVTLPCINLVFAHLTSPHCCASPQDTLSGTYMHVRISYCLATSQVDWYSGPSSNPSLLPVTATATATVTVTVELPVLTALPREQEQQQQEEEAALALATGQEEIPA